MNEVIRTIKSRRSVRAYREEQLKQEEIEQIIEAGIYAPSGHNEQPWHFTVIQNKELIQEINEKSKGLMKQSGIDWMVKMAEKPEVDITYKAPTLIVVSGRKSAISAKTDCCAAIQNMLLAAESMDIGSVWLGLSVFYFKSKENIAKLNIPEDYEPFYAIAFGYKSTDKKLLAPKRNTEVVNYIR